MPNINDGVQSAIVIFLFSCLSMAMSLYIDSAVLGKLAIPALVAGSGYGLLGLGKILGLKKGGGIVVGHHQSGHGYSSHGAVNHIHAGHGGYGGHGYGGYGGGYGGW